MPVAPAEAPRHGRGPLLFRAADPNPATHVTPSGALLEAPTPTAPAAARPDTAPLMERARAIAAGLRARAVHRGGDVIWLMPPAEEGGPSLPMDPHLYSGFAGVAFFLAALDHVRGTAEHRELVLASLAPLRRKIAALVADPERAAKSRVPVGAYVGIGSFIYPLVRAGLWTGEAGLVADAHRATRLLTRERLRADDQHDTVRGVAGTILALLALEEAAPGPNEDGDTPRALAEICAEHLLARRVSHRGAPRSWPIGGEPARTGFAHGAAGTGYALLRLAERTGAAPLVEAALEGFAFERWLYDPAERNWWDPRYDRHLELQSWCFGAPGLALSRLPALAVDSSPELRRELEDALDLTLHHRLEPVDHLCCGNLGRADILLSAADALGREALRDAAAGVARAVITRAPDDEGFGLIPPGTAPMLRLSLFRGVAGIGYALLRLAAPGRLPSVLCME